MTHGEVHEQWSGGVACCAACVLRVCVNSADAVCGSLCFVAECPYGTLCMLPGYVACVGFRICESSAYVRKFRLGAPKEHGSCLNTTYTASFLIVAVEVRLRESYSCLRNLSRGVRGVSTWKHHITPSAAKCLNVVVVVLTDVTGVAQMRHLFLLLRRLCSWTM